MLFIDGRRFSGSLNGNRAQKALNVAESLPKYAFYRSPPINLFCQRDRRVHIFLKVYSRTKAFVLWGEGVGTFRVDERSIDGFIKKGTFLSYYKKELPFLDAMD